MNIGRDGQDPQYARPQTAEFDAAVEVYNLGYPLRAGSAFVAHTVGDVRRVVRDAASTGTRLIPFATGHSASTIGRDDEARLLRTVLEDPIQVDRGRRLVRIPAGALWQDVARKVAALGFAVPHGSSGTVGAIGFLLGGGMSFYGRAWGVASNRVTSISIVTADGDEHEVDETEDPDLFWALRGGGGGFGVVTAITVELERIREVVTGMAVWPANNAAGLLDIWRRWALSADSNISTSFRILNLPPSPGLPPALTSGPVVAIDGLAIDSPKESASVIADGLLKSVRAVSTPLLDSWHRGPVTDALLTHGDPPVPMATAGDSFTIADFSDDAATVWLEAVEAADHPMTALELRQLGGAFREPSPRGGAYDHIEADVLALTVDAVPDRSEMPDRERSVLAVRERLAGHIGAWTAPTFVDNSRSPRRSFDRPIEERVQAIRAAVDPTGMFALDVRASID